MGYARFPNMNTFMTPGESALPEGVEQEGGPIDSSEASAKSSGLLYFIFCSNKFFAVFIDA